MALEVSTSEEDPKGFYYLLGVEKTASQVEVRRAYKKAALVRISFSVSF